MSAVQTRCHLWQTVWKDRLGVPPAPLYRTQMSCVVSVAKFIIWQIQSTNIVFFFYFYCNSSHKHWLLLERSGCTGSHCLHSPRGPLSCLRDNYLAEIGERTQKGQNGDAVNDTTVLKNMKKKSPVGSLLHLRSFRSRKKIPNREEKLKRAQRVPVPCPHRLQTDVFPFWWQCSTDNIFHCLPMIASSAREIVRQPPTLWRFFVGNEGLLFFLNEKMFIRQM